MNPLSTGAAAAIAACALLACDIGGSGPGGAVEPNPAINATTSYARLLGTARIHPTRAPLARAYFSLRGDAVEDLLSVDLTATEAATAVRFFKNDGAGVFTETPGVFGESTPSLVHARKAVVNDFNADGFDDVVIAGHGYDQPPYPGEIPIIIRNNAGQALGWSYLPLPVDFYHSVTAGDIDNDGYPDLFFTPGVFLVNDRKGGFVADRSLFPAELAENYFTSELYDLNGDGYLDLIITGHEQDGAASRILWGNETGTYRQDRSSVLPAVAGRGVAIGISLADVTGDGAIDILLNRTGDPTGLGFYVGYYLQLIDGKTLRDVTAARVAGHFDDAGEWFYWVRFFDIDHDGDLDIVLDDEEADMAWINDGTGRFSRE